MKILEQVNALEGLVGIDVELRILGERYAQESGELGEKRTRVGELEERIARARAALEDMERTRGESNQDFRQLGTQLERSREKLSRCRSEREANAVQRELEELRKLSRDRELEIQKLSEFASQARSDIEKSSAELEALKVEIGGSEGAVAASLATLEGELKAKRDERQSFVERVPAQLYRRYELIRTRREPAVSHTSDGTCSVCHMTLAPALFQQLRRGEGFDQCPSCNRIIYFRVPTSIEPGPCEDD